MKIAGRCLVFVLGMSLLIFGWRRSHNDVMSSDNPRGNNSVRSSELMVVVGGLIAMMAFLPTNQALGRLAATSPKRRKPTQSAHFRRRRKT